MVFLPAISTSTSSMWTGLLSPSPILGLAVERNLGVVAVGQRPAFDRSEGRVLLAHAVQRLLDFFVGDRDLRLVGAQILVALDLDLGHHFKAGFEAQGFVVLQVKIGDLRLRNRDQSLLVGFFAEIARDQRLDHIALQVFGKTLADDGCGHMSAAEAGDARQLLIFLDQGCSLAIYFFDRNFNCDLPPGAAGGLSGAHICLSGFDRSDRSILG